MNFPGLYKTIFFGGICLILLHLTQAQNQPQNDNKHNDWIPRTDNNTFRELFAQFVTETLSVESCSRWPLRIGQHIRAHHENGCLDGGAGSGKDWEWVHSGKGQVCANYSWLWWRLEALALKTTYRAIQEYCLDCWRKERECTIRTTTCNRLPNQQWKMVVFPWQVKAAEDMVYFSIVSMLHNDSCLHVVDNSTSAIENVPDLECQKEGVCVYLQRCGPTYTYWQSFFLENAKAQWQEYLMRLNRIQDQDQCESKNGPQGNSPHSKSLESGQNILVYLLGSLCLLLFLILGLGFIFLWRKYSLTQKTLKNLSRQEIEEFIYGNPERLMGDSSLAHENAVHMPYNKDYDIPEADLLIEKTAVLGKGAYGVVTRGFWKNQPVAVKTTEPNVDISYFKALLKEIKVMAYVGHHENVVKFLGAMTKRISERMVFVVVELSPHGNLHSFLIDQRSSFDNTLHDNSKGNLGVEFEAVNSLYDNVQVTLTSLDLVSFSHQIAKGMEYLANRKVLHGDLATRNILVFDNKLVKLTDFGLSRKLYEYGNYVKTQSALLPWRWLSVEALKDMQFSTASDVWSYGVTLWEIFTLAQCPYPGMAYTLDFIEKLESGLRLQKPKYATQNIYDEMWKCWNVSPDSRPTFTQLSDSFATLLTKYNYKNPVDA